MIKSPAKLIITGEHSVLYNQTAVTCAIDKYLYCLKDENTKNNYGQDTLVTACLRAFFEYTKIPPRLAPFKIASTIARKSGLGSSAALIVSILLYLQRFFHVKLDEKTFLHLAQKIEDIQHGKSSGIDIKTIFYGGVCAFEGSEFAGRVQDQKHLLQDITIVNTGHSRYPTRMVVEYVKQNHQKDTGIWTAFAQIAKGIYKAIELGNLSEFNALLAQNQKLLEKIGVVSPRVVEFIQDLSVIGLTGKVCGAGTIGLTDEGSGFLGIFQRVEEGVSKEFSRLIKKYGYAVEHVKVEGNGAKVHVD